MLASVPDAAARIRKRSPEATTKLAAVPLRVKDLAVLAANAVPPVALVVFASVAANKAAEPEPAWPRLVIENVMKLVSFAVRASTPEKIADVIVPAV